MVEININSAKFKFQYLPDYAAFLLNNKLEEFTQVAIRFCREADLPMLRPLAHMSEKDLIALSMGGNRELLTALSSNNITPFIENNIKNFVSNQINDATGKKLIDRSEVMTEDVILAFYLRRKAFAFFLYAYTQNTVIHTLIIAEMDFYTTEEQLLTSKAIIKSQEAGN